MPIYEYRCSECGFQDEFLQKLSDPLMTVCPSCGKESLKKLLSAAGFQLKGSGWYATDFKGGGSNAAPASGSKPAAKSSGESASSSSDSAASSAPKAAPADPSG